MRITEPGSVGKTYRKAFTLIELLAVVGIIGILASMVVPRVFSSIEDARYASAIQSLRSHTTDIIKYGIKHGNLPSDWSDFGRSSPPTDPWGNEYVYLNHKEISPGKRRKDGPTVPINSNFDLFSPGPDGEWTSTIQAKKSVDDVVVAGDGGFIGRAEDY